MSKQKPTLCCNNPSLSSRPVFWFNWFILFSVGGCKQFSCAMRDYYVTLGDLAYLFVYSPVFLDAHISCLIFDFSKASVFTELLIDKLLLLLLFPLWEPTVQAFHNTSKNECVRHRGQKNYHRHDLQNSTTSWKKNCSYSQCYTVLYSSWGHTFIISPSIVLTCFLIVADTTLLMCLFSLKHFLLRCTPVCSWSAPVISYSFLALSCLRFWEAKCCSRGAGTRSCMMIVFTLGYRKCRSPH